MMTKNPIDIKPNIKSTQYFIDVCAIPFIARQNYLKKLLNREKAYKQKNVILLKEIYHICDKENLSRWDPARICNSLKISIKQLYWHKHKLLKGLREYYFLELNGVTLKDIQDKKDDLNSQISLARYLNKKGMRKESLRIYFKIERTFSSAILEKYTPETILLLSEVYEEILRFYYDLRMVKQYNAYLTKALKIYSVEIKLRTEQLKLMKIRLNLALAYKEMFHTHSRSSMRKAGEFLFKALKYADDKKFAVYKVQILFRSCLIMKQLETDYKNYKSKLFKNLRIALETAIENNLTVESLALKAITYSLTCINKKTFYEIEKIIGTLKNDHPVSHWTTESIFETLNLLNKYSPELFNSRLKELINHYQLNCEIPMSRYFSFILQTRNSSLFDLTQTNRVIYLKKTDNRILKQLEESALKALFETRNISYANYRDHIILHLYMFEFLKGRNCNFENSFKLLRSLERIKKIRDLTFSNFNPFLDLLKIGILMFENSQKYNSKNETLDNYFKPLKQTMDEIFAMDNKGGLIDESYLLFSFITYELGYPELHKCVKEYFDLIIKRYPSQLKAIKRQYREVALNAA